MQRTLIWDVPTRVFHWTLAFCFVGAWLTSESDRWLGVHVFCGYVMLGLLAFRLLWGVLGTHHARFASFWFGPRAAYDYLRQVLRGQAARHIGHNPAGSLAIYLLLLLTLLVGLTGVFTLGGEEQHGAVAGWMGFTAARAFKKLHEASAIAMLVLVLAHLGGVLVELLQDTALELAPVMKTEAQAMLARLKGQAMLRGFRGAEPVDQDQLAEVIVRLAEFLDDQQALIAELDVNPLICSGGRIMAVDALIIRKA